MPNFLSKEISCFYEKVFKMGYLEMRMVIWRVYTYIQSGVEGRVRVMDWSIPQFYRATPYMDRRAHGSILHMYHIYTHGIRHNPYGCRRISPHKPQFPVDTIFSPHLSCPPTSRTNNTRTCELCGDLYHTSHRWNGCSKKQPQQPYHN